MHLRNRCGGLGQGAATRTGEQISMPPGMQTAQQMQHLKGTAVEMTAALDVEDPHDFSTCLAASITASTRIRCMQSSHGRRSGVAGPPQVGRRLQGEQGSR